MPRFLTSKSCLWYPTSCSYCSITVLILASHSPGQWGDHQWGKYPCPCPDSVSQQTWPGAPANTACHHASRRAATHYLLSRQNLIPVSCHHIGPEREEGSSFSWKAARNFFSNFSKEIWHTRESHGEGEMLCCWSFLFQLKYSLHIYMFLNT